MKRLLLLLVLFSINVMAQDSTISTQTQDTQNPTLIKAIKDDIEKRFLAFYKSHNIKINFLEITPLVERNLAKFEIERIIFDNKDLKKQSGNFEVHLKHNERKKKVFFNFTIDANIDALSAVGNIKSGEVIDKNNTTITQIPLVRNMTLPVSADILDKYTAKSFIVNGSAIIASKITPKIIVRKGDVLNVAYNTNEININFNVKALENGAMGQTIRAENLQSGKELKIIIIDSKRGTVAD